MRKITRASILWLDGKTARVAYNQVHTPKQSRKLSDLANSFSRLGESVICLCCHPLVLFPQATDTFSDFVYQIQSACHPPSVLSKFPNSSGTPSLVMSKSSQTLLTRPSRSLNKRTIPFHYFFQPPNTMLSARLLGLIMALSISCSSLILWSILLGMLNTQEEAQLRAEEEAWWAIWEREEEQVVRHELVEDEAGFR